MTIPALALILKFITYADYTVHMAFNMWADLNYTAYVTDTVITVVAIAAITGIEKIYEKVKSRH
jgi:hypothetical protein